ncbi:hypothetical protein [Luteolibacter sp. LG18]|uniref:hypothetical protein n=1 Tax=Luteolibacter sp. LG18 TaxID=2819286 RepID=UPI002B29F832|nr:hypothetical protein llg_41210 [Luteolibacter sp. LG18]
MDALIRILVEDVLIFANSDEEQMAEDFAVVQLERIASDLLSAGDGPIQQFHRVVEEMIREAKGSGNESRQLLLQSLPSHLGLI